MQLKPRWMALLVVLLLIVGACGAETSDTSTTVAAGATTTAGGTETTGGDGATSTTTASAPLEGKIVVWDWHFGNLAEGTFGAAYQKLDEMFLEMHPGVEIEHVGQPFANYFDALRAALSAGSGPDAAAFFAGPNIESFREAIIPLDDYLTPEMVEERAGLSEVSTRGNLDDETWGLPQGYNGNVWYFNKQLFRDAGLDPENPPTTYDELVAAAEALKESGVIPIAGGNQEGFVVSWVWTLLWPGNGTNEEAIGLGYGDIDWDHPTVVKTAEQLKNLFDNYWDPDFASSPLFQGPSIDKFKLGEAAIFPGLTSGPSASYVEFNAALGEENVGVFHVTGEEEPNYVPFGTAHAWAITKRAENPDLVWEYIKFLTGPEAGQLLLDETGMYPNHSAVVVPDDLPEQVQRFADGIERWGTAYLPHGWFGPESAEWGPKMQEMLAGGCEIPQCFESVQQVRDDYLATLD
jgi:ABC-type glycerol-3-phosphate transport system substrate-binding protein